MKTETKILLDEYKSKFKTYKEFLDKNDWINDVFTDNKGVLYSNKLSTELAIIDTILKSMVKFKADVGDDLSLKVVKDFINTVVTIVKKHISKIDQYEKLNPIYQEDSDPEEELENFNFQTKLFQNKVKSKVALSKLNIDEEELRKKSAEIFYGDQKAPLMMREYLYDRIEIVKNKTDALGIDFSVPHINPATSNEMLINMKAKDIPPWLPNKHFFEQEKSTIQFWEEEKIKIKNGINIGGYHLSGWLYWHTNIFKLNYGAEDEKDIKVALFRDNEYFFDHMYNRAKSKEYGRHGLFLYGTRRYAKSAGMASRLLYGLWTIKNASATVQGFSKVPDLEALVKYSSDAINEMYPALKIPANSLSLDDGIILGIKEKKVQDRLDFSSLSIINLEGGNTRQGSQKTAGSTPDIFLLDECGKGKSIPPWKAAMPSFAGGKGGKWRLVPMLSGTAGEGALSVDAESMLKDPKAYSILPMDWDHLEAFVDPDLITWDRNTFGFFVPAQMSLEAPDKIIKPFGEFLDIGIDTKKLDLDALNKMNIEVTDWQAGKEFFEEKRENVKNDLSLLAGETNSFPLTPEDCYVSSEKNKFPGLHCKRRRNYIHENGLEGQKVWLVNNAGNIEVEMTNDPVIDVYPFKGGNFEAPIVILDNPYNESPNKPPLGLYCIGYDDVKHSKSDGDSVMSATVFKRSYEGGEWANRIVAYYDSRPAVKKDYYRNLYLLIKFYNARVLFENEDTGFIDYMEEKHMEDVFMHISDGVGLATEENLNRNKNRRFGWAPTPVNIYNLENTMVIYTKEENVVIGENQDLMGVDRINHPMLLEEFYKYKKDNNADRIRSFGLALKLARYYDKTYAYMKSRKVLRNEEEDGYKKKKKPMEVRGLTFTKGLSKY